MLFLLKMKPENNWQMAMNLVAGTQPQKSGNQNTTMCFAQSILKKKREKRVHRLHAAEHSVWAQIHVCRGVHRVTDLEKIPAQISKDEALTPLPVVGPLFISPFSFHLSCALLDTWRFGLFRCFLQLSQQARPHQGTCLLLGVLFSQFIDVCFITCKDEKGLFILVQQTSNFGASQDLGLGQ